jgi:hypothetical protein
MDLKVCQLERRRQALSAPPHPAALNVRTKEQGNKSTRQRKQQYKDTELGQRLF